MVVSLYLSIQVKYTLGELLYRIHRRWRRGRVSRKPPDTLNLKQKTPYFRNERTACDGRHQRSVMTQFSCLCLLVSLPSKCRNQQSSPPHGRRQGRSSFVNDSAKEMEMLFTTFFSRLDGECLSGAPHGTARNGSGKIRTECPGALWHAVS